MKQTKMSNLNMRIVIQILDNKLLINIVKMINKACILLIVKEKYLKKEIKKKAKIPLLANRNVIFYLFQFKNNA